MTSANSGQQPDPNKKQTQPDTTIPRTPAQSRTQGSGRKWPREPPAAYRDLKIEQIPKRLQEEFRQACATEKWPIYLYGPSGRGKSYAMAALYTTWLDGGAIWNDVSSILRNVMRCRMEGSISEDNPGFLPSEVFESTIMNRISRAALACFDDVGIRAPSDAMYDAFYEMVNLRCGRPTVYTGNISPEELSQVYDVRIASRILAGTCIELTGDDLRLKGTRFVKI